MRNGLSVDEYDLAGFFGCLPKQSDSDVAWEYNDSAYEAADSRAHVSFAIAPAYKDVRILLTIDSATVFEFDATGVEDVRVRAEKGRVSLEVIIAPANSLRLLLKPHIAIHQVFAERAAG